MVSTNEFLTKINTNRRLLAAEVNFDVCNLNFFYDYYYRLAGDYYVL